MPKGRDVAAINRGEVTLELPAFAARYLAQMCKRERTLLNNLVAGGSYSLPLLDAAFDALNEIESDLPE